MNDTVIYNTNAVDDFVSFNFGQSKKVDGEIQELSELVRNLGEKSWNSTGGQATGKQLEDFIGGTLKPFAEFLSKKCKDFSSMSDELKKLDKTGV